MKKSCIVAFITLLIITSSRLQAENINSEKSHHGSPVLPETLLIDRIPASDTARNFRKEKLIASILAFPVPFGFTGMHRIYLGSEPWVPVAYLITGGGGCGLLPLIDFIFIVSATEEEFAAYENNPRFFMWVK